MFQKILAGLALAAAFVNADDESVGEQLAQIQCTAFTTSSATVFNLMDLETTTYYSSVVDGASGETLQFNYCAPKVTDDSYAYVVDSDSSNKVVANEAFDSRTNLRDDDNKTIGVTVTQSSGTMCKAGRTEKDDVYYSLKSNIVCDNLHTAKGEAEIVSATYSDCVYEVMLKHKAGCPTIGLDTDQVGAWFQKNEWVLGIIYLITGPLIALFGVAWFPYAMATLVAVFVMGAIIAMCLALGWMATSTGTIVTLIVAPIVGIIAGIIIRRNVWLMIGLLGLVAGFFSGALVFALISTASGWNAVWGYWVISIIMAGLGCWAACHFGKTVVLLSTSMVGSYLFMRSWTLFFPGHWPSESELMDDDNVLDVDAFFWLFLGIFATTFVFSAIFQCMRNKSHEDLDEYEKN